MTNAIDKAEVERVDWIHAALDHWNAVLRNDTLTQGYQISKEGRETIHFSPAEIRDWPKVKAALVAELSDGALVAVHNLQRGVTCRARDYFPDKWDAGCKDCHTRGLCMYRQSAAYLEATGGAKEAELTAALKVGDRVRHKNGALGVLTELAGANRLHLIQFDGEAHVQWCMVENVALAPCDPHQGPTAQEVRESKAPCGCRAGCLGYVCGFNPMPQVMANPEPRTWDADKYAGLDAATYRQLSTLDKRIAAARQLLDRPLTKPSRHDARPRDLEQAWATSTWEEG